MPKGIIHSLTRPGVNIKNWYFTDLGISYNRQSDKMFVSGCS